MDHVSSLLGPRVGRVQDGGPAYFPERQFCLFEEQLHYLDSDNPQAF